MGENTPLNFMKSTKSILFLLSLFLISNCGENLIEEVKERYDDGKMKVVEYYKKDGDNKILVKQREYYKTGEVEEECTFQNGKLEGKYTEYYKSGQIAEEGTFKNGKLEGKYIHYDINGSIKKEEIYYKNGELVE